MISSKIKSYLNNFFWVISTYLLAPVFYLLILFRKKNESLKILVVQTAQIGDLVCTTPVFREIKKKFPSSHLTVMVNSQTKDVLRNNSRIDEIILIGDYSGIRGRLRLIGKLRKDKYDWILCLFPDSFTNILGFWSLIPQRAITIYRNSGEANRLLSVFNNKKLEHESHSSRIGHYLSLLKFMGITANSKEKELFINPKEEKKSLDFLRESGLREDDLLVGIAVTAGVEFKQWEPVKFAGLADQLIEKIKAKIIFIGSANDKDIIEKVQKTMHNISVDASGCFKLNELPALMKKLKLFISVDTGPLYIADAVNVPLVDIAGPVDVREQSPLHNRCRIVQKDLYCCPCLFSPAFARFCKEGHLKCLNEVGPNDVFDAAVSLLNRNKEP